MGQLDVGPFFSFYKERKFIMKLKKILLGVLAVFTLGIVSIANAPKAYADEREPFDFENGELIVEGESFNLGKYTDLTSFKIKVVIESEEFEEIIEFKRDDLIIYPTNDKYSMKKQYDINNYTNVPYPQYTVSININSNGTSLLNSVESFYDIEFNFRYNTFGELEAKVYYYEETGDVITPGGSGTTVPPIINDEGIINPIYLYTALGVVVLAVGGYIISLGNKKRKK